MSLILDYIYGTAEIFRSLGSPRDTWPRLAAYLRSQQDLVKARGSDAELLAIDDVVHARNALRRSRNDEHQQFWDSTFLCTP